MISAKSKYVRFRELGEWSKSVINRGVVPLVMETLLLCKKNG